MPPVLIVDDDEDVRRLLRILLVASGFETMTARNGLDALDQMRQQLPCLVLLDVKMPEMDGTEFRRRQLADPALRDVPVVCLTGHYEPEQVTMELGVTCLKKPLHFPEVVDTVQARCGLVRPPIVPAMLRESPTPPDRVD